MARRVTDISNDVDSYVLLSQTPKNYSKDNFFIKELQDKVDAEWPYRFNRVDVEFEKTWGQNDYLPLEVVQQHVKSDTGVAYTDDYRRLVFRDIREKRFKVGSKFRFMPDNSIPDVAEIKEKGYDPRSTWLVTNFSSVKATTSVIVTRCNGSLGSLWYDEQHVAHRHYEPLIQPVDLTSTTLFFNQTATSPQSEFVGVVQHNQYTREYQVNQRFIIGYDKVYRIMAIDKFYQQDTNDPEKVGLMKIYFEITETSVKDDFNTKIAYQNQPEVIMDKVKETVEEKSFSVHILSSDNYIPTDLGSKPFEFSAYLFANDLPYEETDVPVCIEVQLLDFDDNLSSKNVLDYVDLVQENNAFIITRKRIYNAGKIQIKCYVTEENSPTGKEISTMFKMLLAGL